MTNKVIIGIVVGFVLLTGRGLESGVVEGITSGMRSLNELAVQSPVIVYARADTNNLPNMHLMITEIWKGTSEISQAGVVVGTEISQQWPANGGPAPDAAVLFYQQGPPSSERLWLRSEYYVRGGRFGGMTIQEFKAKL
jgi:hypothetical protein